MPSRGKPATTAEAPPGDSVPAQREGPAQWRPDPLLEGFEFLTLTVGEPALPEEGVHPLSGTLVRRSGPRSRHHRRAVIQVHGWNDYFFHPHVAEFWENQGVGFHALDLRRYGRSLRPGQLHGYIADLADYAQELDAAVEVVRETHDTVVLSGHSTGGLIVSLYAADRPGVVDGLVLNSPWLDMWGPPAVTAMLKPLLREWSKRSPTSTFPRAELEENVSARAMHASYGGEWDYSFDLKTDAPEPIRVGWFKAILQGHSRVAGGLGIECPVLVTTSTRTAWLKRYSPEARETDTVLDVNRIHAVAWRLGTCVTSARIEGGTHDLSLSPLPARRRWFETVATWLRAWVPVPLPLEE